MIIITGGQTGADQAGWRAAKAAGLETTGWMPRDFLTEDGPRPEFAEMYGAKETESRSYPERTRRNAQWADVTLWFGDPASRGGRLTLRACEGPYVVIWATIARYNWPHERIAEWLQDPRLECRVLNIAGNRESNWPGIGRWVERYLTEVFRLIAAAPAAPPPPPGALSGDVHRSG